MARNLPNWIEAYTQYTEGTEAPKLMHFWCGISALAGALRRKVWIDMRRFKWYPNFYIVLVARPGIVSKTTTMDLAHELLKQVPGIHYGPDEVTREGLITTFAGKSEMFQFGEDFLPMSAITLASGELGSLINPQDRLLMNTYIQLWDGRPGYEKVTKMSGNDAVNAPWINMIGCTTPSWIADNLPKVAVGGGFVSRCVFVFADAKEEFVALPDENDRAERFDDMKALLVEDLTHIATNIVGPMAIEEPARVWIRKWYKELWTAASQDMENDQLDGFVARRQTHLMKLAMILSVARSDDRQITYNDVVLAHMMLEATAKDIARVFDRLGRTDEAEHVEKLLSFIKKHKEVPYMTAYRYVHAHFPDAKVYEGVVAGLMRSGQITIRFTSAADMANAILVYVDVDLS